VSLKFLRPCTRGIKANSGGERCKEDFSPLSRGTLNNRDWLVTGEKEEGGGGDRAQLSTKREDGVGRVFLDSFREKFCLRYLF
jgi:hypothetical protein